jgi:hypothetical protein
MSYAGMVDHLQHFVHHFDHVERNTNRIGGNQPLISELRLPRSAFSGLFVAGLVATFFWGGLALLILRVHYIK